MRVIAGECKGRQLKAMSGNNTRPTTDKVKESIFNIIGPFFDGGQGLDLYSGSGGLGIEALSRGLEKVIFIDHHPKAIDVIKQNIEKCKLEACSEVYRNDVGRAIKVLQKKEEAFQIIFMDPPYEKQQLGKDLEGILKGQLIANGGLIVIEHTSDLDLPAEMANQLQRWKYETYNGKTAVSIYRYLQ